MIDKNWFEIPLGQLGTFRNGINFNYTQEGPGIAIVKVKDFGDLFFVPYEGMDELASHLIDVPENLTLKEGDTLIIRSNGNRELLGRSLYFRGGNRRVTFSGFCIRFRPATDKIHPLFATYFIKSPFCRARFTAYGSGTGIHNLNQGILSDIPVPLPPLPEQQAIAHILGSLDDKIELNRQMNETLEAIARALFKSWFVDFDPVRAKMEGRVPYGMDAETAALFPDGFEDSVLGKVPRGWKIGVIGDLGQVICGKTPLTSDHENYGEEIPFITIPDMHGKVFITQTNKFLSYKGAQTQKNKMIPSNAICVSCIATPGIIALTTTPSQTNQQINTVIPTSEIFTYYCYGILQESIDEIKARASGGSVTPNLNKGYFSTIPVLLAPEKIVKDHYQRVQSFFEKILANELQNHTLSTIRDTLLPKLLSGEIRVGDMEREVRVVF